MVLFVRYVLLIVLGFGSAIVLVKAASGTGIMLAADGGAAISHIDGIYFWVLAGIATISAWSMLKFAFQVFPEMINQWFEKHRERIVTVMLGLLVCFVFVVS